MVIETNQPLETTMTIAQYNAQSNEIIAHYEALLVQEQDSVEIKLLKVDLADDLRRLNNSKLAAEIY
jgi:hypothetical protein